MSVVPPSICPQCGQISHIPDECSKCGVIFSKYKAVTVEPAFEDVIIDTNPFRSKQFEIGSVPVVLLISFLLQKIWVFKILSFFIAVIPLHELGHAITAWMGGRWAAPLGAIVPSAGMTLVGQNRIEGLIYFLICVLCFCVYQSWKTKVYYLIVVSLLALLGTFYLSFAIPNETLSLYISHGGIAGEFILSALMIGAFHHNLSSRFRWDFVRIPFLAIGSLCFVNAFVTWKQIEKKVASLPLGSAISSSGAKDSNGDMNKLLAAGWTEDQITSSYLFILKITLAWIVINFLWGLLKNHKQNPGF